MEVKEISYNVAKEFLLPRHYSGRIPSISVAFGLFENKNLVAVCTFGKPASPSLCTGVCGVEYSRNVYELNRLCRIGEYIGQLSKFVGKCLRELKKKDWIIVSYSDTGMHHNGYIYQACNFIYTGKTKERTDKYTEGNKHSRHYKVEEQAGFRKVRTSKHRYIYFCTNNRKLKKEWLSSLTYDVMPYPKGENKNYKLGEYMKEIVIKDGKEMFKRTTGKGDTLYKQKHCVIGIDQSYSRTGISIAVDGVLKKVTSLDFKNVKTKTAKRLLLQVTLRKAIISCLGKFPIEEIGVVCERMRTITAGSEIRPGVIKPGAAMIAYIVDTAAEFDIEVWSADTRSWKAKVLGSSRPIFEPIEGVKDPQKFGSVRKVIELGFEKEITRCRNNGAFKCYDDDAADSACIALYAFVKNNTLMREY